MAREKSANSGRGFSTKADKGKKRRAEALLNEDEDKNDFFLNEDNANKEHSADEEASDVEETAEQKRLRISETHTFIPHTLAVGGEATPMVVMTNLSNTISKL